MATAETVLRRIEKRCRDDISALTENGKPIKIRYLCPMSPGNGPVMPGATGEVAGHVDCCREIKKLCREIRRSIKQEGRRNTFETTPWRLKLTMKAWESSKK